MRLAVRQPAPAAAPPRVQTKLRVSRPGDADEREADRIADALVRSSAADLRPHAHGEGIQRACCASCSSCDEKKKKETELHRSASEIAPPEADASIVDGLRGGEPLAHETRAFFESRFRHDFGAVRVHRDAHAGELARRLGARAFTYGNDIVFSAGEYSPDGANALRLLGHELTHVVQQRRSGAAVQRKLGDPPQGPGTPPVAHSEFDKTTGTVSVYVDNQLVMTAKFPGGTGGIKVDTRFDASGMLQISARVTPGVTFQIVESGLTQLNAKYPKLNFTATQAFPQPEPIAVFHYDIELMPREYVPPSSPRPPVVEPEPEPEPDEGFWGTIGEWVHGGLDVIGVIPGAGEIADGINALIYVAEGRYAEAAISAAAMIPIAGDLGKVGKWTVKVGRELTEAGTETLTKRGAKETAQEVAEEIGERELREELAEDAAEEAAERAAKQADEAASAGKKPKKKDEPDPACSPFPVRHLGGHARHNRCADILPPNQIPGMDWRVRTKRFDALQAGTRILWEMKTNNYSLYKSKWLKDRVITKHIAEALIEQGIAASCGYHFVFCVTDAQHERDLKAQLPTVDVRHRFCP